MSEIRYILASASPRRRELMAQAGFQFKILPAVGEEKAEGLPPAEAVRQLSRQKAEEVADRLSGGERGKTGGTASGSAERIVVIGADTLVALDGQILGKPGDRADAKRMLAALAGRTHEVYTGVTVIELSSGLEPVRELGLTERTEVDFLPVSDEEIEDYLDTGEPFDKAGAYGIQGRFAVHIRGVRGDFYNVMGLPVAALYALLKDNGLLAGGRGRDGRI